MSLHTDTSSLSSSGMGVTSINKRGKRLVEKYQKLSSERVNWEQQWQDVLEQTMPQAAYVTRRRQVEGERVDERIFDSTPKRANQVLAAGFHGNLTNPSTKWFRLRLQDPALNGVDEVKVWLADSEQKILDVLNTSNFNQQIHQTYLDLGSTGTSVLFEVEDPIDIVRFNAIPIIEIVIDEDHRGRVNSCYWKYKLSASQAQGKFGDQAGETVRKLMEAGKFNAKVTFLHCIAPRAVFDPSSELAIDMPWESTQVEFDTGLIVAEGGFMEFPVFVTRFNKVSGDRYGYSPGIVMLPDMKMLQAITKTIIKAAQKIVDPPLQLPHDGFILPLKTIPAGLNFGIGGQPGDKIEPIETKGNIPVGRDMQNDLREQITRGYFNDLFATLADRRNMTATEVTERITEKMLLLGPTLGRLQSEMLDPIIDRTFGILLRNGVLQPPPDVLVGREILFEYVSPLALAQRRENRSGMNNLLALAGQMAQFDPSVLDKINADAAIEEAHDIFGVSPEILNDDETVQKIRENRAQQAALQQAAAGAQAQADTAKVEAETEKALSEAGT